MIYIMTLDCVTRGTLRTTSLQKQAAAMDMKLEVLEERRYTKNGRICGRHKRHVRLDVQNGYE